MTVPKEWTPEQPGAFAPPRRTELQQTNEAVREEVMELRQKCAELEDRLNEALLGIQADRQTRRAALNLMEDAEESRRVAQEELIARRRVEEELRDASRRKDEFLAMLAHELRTPLAPIRNSLHILQLGGVDSGAAQQVVAIMERQVNHMVRLVDDLLEVSRISKGKIDLRKEEVELAAVVRNAVETSRPLIDAANHQLAISLPAEPVVLFADPVRLAQVFSNLLNNATKYTDEGGQIWLSAACDENTVKVTVSDTGVGVSAEMLPKIFDLFTQVERSNGRAQGGLGIGLTLVRNLVALHGGEIEARSGGLGKGSEFMVRLPIVKRGPALVRTSEKRRYTICCRVLVVDDTRDAADSLCTLLRLLGAEAEAVNDGRAALAAVESQRPKVVLCDIGMPGMDGYEVARRVREQPKNDDVKLIALTGWGQEDDRRRSREAGFDYHLVKPVDIGALQALLSAIPQG